MQLVLGSLHSGPVVRQNVTVEGAYQKARAPQAGGRRKGQRDTGLGEGRALRTSTQRLTSFLPDPNPPQLSKPSQTVSPAGYSEHTAPFGEHFPPKRGNVPVNCSQSSPESYRVE